MNLQGKIYGNNEAPYPLDYVNDIGEAIIRVDEKYCEWAYNYSNYNQKTERVFAYELYHQFKLLTIWDNKYKNLRLDGEIGKKVNESIEQCSLNIPIFNQTQFILDLVIHFGQTDRSDHQKVIIELKTKKLSNKRGDLEVKKTILKLNHYLRVLNFQYAIFLSVNTDFTELSRQLKDLIGDPSNEAWEERFTRIIVLNYRDSSLSAKTLFDILVN